MAAAAEKVEENPAPQRDIAEKDNASHTSTNDDDDDSTDRVDQNSLRRHISIASAEAAAAGAAAEMSMAAESIVQTDPNAIGWDGPDDPANPMNWPDNKKWATVILISLMTILTPLGSSMFAPGVPDIMAEFKSRDETLATFVVSVYVLGFAFGPLLAAPMSEIYGRAICYNVANVAFVIFTVGTALSQNMGMMIAFRFLMGFAGSTPITNGSGSIADMFPIEKRGRAMSVWAMGPMLGPCIGPVAGGYLVQYLNWRWVFWIMAMAGGAISLAGLFLVNETYHPKLVGNKVRKLRKETGNPDLYNALEDQTTTEKMRLKLAIIRPLKILFMLPSVSLMSLYVAVIYGILYLMISTFTFVFGANQYGFSTGTVGLSYIPTGIGCIVGMVLFGALTDMEVKKRQKKGETPVPEDRLAIYMIVLTGVTTAVSLFWYGWSVQQKVHWICPMIAVAVFCFGLMGVMMTVQIYLIDCYIQYAASVIAALTVFRSIVGAFLPMAGLSMYNKLGYGWGNSLLGFLCLILAPAPLFFWKYGARIRARFQIKL
uniref:Major facilitator superfamily (MFS) profile domain-containing protein n=1 Tax=Bionectria ochroleuca TaxID=29856 RepID=A0A8H7TU77_BIOOC